jgi:hypothetical protein
MIDAKKAKIVITHVYEMSIHQLWLTLNAIIQQLKERYRKEVIKD